MIDSPVMRPRHPRGRKKKIAELRKSHLENGTPFPGARSDDKKFASAYRSTVVLATGTGRYARTEQEKRSDAALAISRGDRSLAEAILFGRRPNAELAEIRRLSKETGCSFEEVRLAQAIEKQGGKPAIDTLHRIRLANEARRIARAAELQREEDQRALFNDLSASGTEQLKILADVKAGIRPAEPGTLKYGFLDLRSDYGCGPSDAGFNGRPRYAGGQSEDPQQSLRTHPYFSEGENDPWDDDNVSDEDVRCHHIRCASGHAGCARQSGFEQGCAHVRAQSAHTAASESRSRAASKEARAASFRANHWSDTQVS